MEQYDIKKNKYGQYFTPSYIADFMVKLSSKDKESKVLEPSCGEGVFIDSLLDNGFNYITALEIDNTLNNPFDFVKYESFVTRDFKNEKFDLVIGNPPYIRWKNLEEELKEELGENEIWNRYFNSLCDYLYIFILKSIELLNDNGELIFICPEYWMNTTHAITLRNYMVKNGYFESIIHFNETPIFENANVSIVIFKYIKSKIISKQNIEIYKYCSNKKIDNILLENLLKGKVDQNVIKILTPQFLMNERWILEDEFVLNELKRIENYCKKINTEELFDIGRSYNTLGEICDIGNGMVSGLDKAFQIQQYEKLNELEQNNVLKVIKAKNLEQYRYNNITNYIFIQDMLQEDLFAERMPNFYNHLVEYKEQLMKRYMYNRDIKYWEWVFLRNYKLFSKSTDKIFIPCKERISHKDYFRFTYVGENIYPTQDVTAIFKKDKVKESIYYILGYLNLPIIFNWIKNNGIVKGNIVEFSEKPISSIPFRRINWNDPTEVSLHNEIVELVKTEIQSKTVAKEITFKFNILFNINGINRL